MDTTGLCSQSWDDFEQWQPDVVITVCDKAAGESCPLWFGRAMKVHWGLSDPSALTADQTGSAAAFRETIAILQRRIQSLLDTNFETMSTDEQQALFTDLEAL